VEDETVSYLRMIDRTVTDTSTTEVYSARTTDARERAKNLRSQGYEARIERLGKRESQVERDRNGGLPVVHVRVYHPGSAPPQPPATPASVAALTERLARERALNRESRRLRGEVMQASSDLGALAVPWEPTAAAEDRLCDIEAELVRLTAAVQSLRALRTAVAAEAWTPKPEDL